MKKLRIYICDSARDLNAARGDVPADAEILYQGSAEESGDILLSSVQNEDKQVLADKAFTSRFILAAAYDD